MRSTLGAFVPAIALGSAVAAGACATGMDPGGFVFDAGEAAAHDAGGSSRSSGAGGSDGAGGSGSGSGSAGSGSTSGSSGASSGSGSAGSGSSSGGSGSSSGTSSGSGSGSGSSGADASGLDPGLVLPDPGGAPCADPGQTPCPGAQICRISSTTGGTCESCTNCGNLHAPCVTDADCDILFQCYEGFCDPLCQLSTPQTCGVPTDCIDVGNATTGVCKYP